MRSHRTTIKEVDHLRVAAIDALPAEIPPYVQAFLTRKIRKEITVKEAGSLGHHVPMLFAVCGYREPVRYFCESFILRCTDPEFITGISGSQGFWPHLQWCAQHVGLTGYAEALNITRPTSSRLTGKIERFVTNPDANALSDFGTIDSPGGMWIRSPDVAIQEYAREMGRIMFLRLSPGENALGWDRADCDAELEAIAADLRARIGLDPELQDLGAPDPVVILPDGFTSIYDTTNPDFGPAGGYTPPVPTIYLTAGTDPAVIAHHRNTTPATTAPTPAPSPPPTPTAPAAAPQEHSTAIPIPGDADITPYWDAVEHHLGTHADEVLNPPATEEDITRLETTLGLTLPAQLRASLARHNGMATYPEDNFPGEILLSCEQILDQYETWQHVFEDLTEDTAEFNLTGDTGLTLPGFWNPGWIPITDDGTGNALVTDTTPGPNGTIGQILAITTDGESEGLIYPNLATLLNSYATKITDHRNTTTQP